MDQLEVVLEESRKAYEEEQEIRKLIEEIEQKEREDEIQRKIQYEEEELQKKLKESKINEIKAHENEVLINGENNMNEEELRRAIEESLATHEREQTRNTYNQRTRQILDSLDQPPPGRYRQCIEIPKDTGKLVVGLHYHHTKEIARRAGGDCKIRFLPRNISINFDGQMGDCLLIEANNLGSVENAESWLLRRVADLFFDSLQPESGQEEPNLEISRKGKSNQRIDMNQIELRRQRQEAKLESLPSFQPVDRKLKSCTPQVIPSLFIVEYILEPLRKKCQKFGAVTFTFGDSKAYYCRFFQYFHWCTDKK